MSDELTNLGEKVAEKIIKAGLATAGEIQGCTDDEIADVEAECNVNLPVAYKSFLKYLGKSSGEFLRGYVCHYPNILSKQDNARRVIKRNNLSTEIGEDEFVFVGSQGTTFFYFNVQDPDPAVYILSASHGEPEKFSDSFSDWLWEMVELQT